VQGRFDLGGHHNGCQAVTKETVYKVRGRERVAQQFITVQE